MGGVINLKDLLLLDWALLSLVVYQIKFVLMPTMHFEFRDALGLRRLRTTCPGDRY